MQFTAASRRQACESLWPPCGSRVDELIAGRGEGGVGALRSSHIVMAAGRAGRHQGQLSETEFLAARKQRAKKHEVFYHGGSYKGPVQPIESKRGTRYAVTLSEPFRRPRVRRP
eukprot:scaffold64380_cov60-Phaeocystis_antarctica.AAC.6